MVVEWIVHGRAAVLYRTVVQSPYISEWTFRSSRVEYLLLRIFFGFSVFAVLQKGDKFERSTVIYGARRVTVRYSVVGYEMR
jgi:hypothetical protein